MLSAKRRECNSEGVGEHIRQARDKAGFTQKALADALDIGYYTLISQMELGYMSVPAPQWVDMARVLRMDRGDFVTRCLSSYHPDIYKAVFGNRGRQEAAAVLRLLEQGKLDRLISKSIAKEVPDTEG